MADGVMARNEGCGVSPGNMSALRSHSVAGLIPGFEPMRLPGAGVEIDALVGGSGPPLLLLHGYPQTRLVWRYVAPLLAEHFFLVMPDLRGYGRSDKPAGDFDHHRYSKREMARDQIATMGALGFDRFHVAGHDRGGRVAYRLALDAPEAVIRLAVLDIVPTADVWRGPPASMMPLYHWTFLAQKPPIPEVLLEGRAEDFMRSLLTRWTAADGGDDAALADYLACGSTPEAIHAGCEDYRAGWYVDRVHDEADRGQRRLGMPTLILWGESGAVAPLNPLRVWSNWAPDLAGHALPCGHFIPEEAPVETAAALTAFFRA